MDTPPAWAAEVVSSNIVGYTKVTASAGLTMVGQQFVEIGAGDRTIQGITLEGGDPWGTDSMRIWNGSSYTDYYWFGEDAGGLNTSGLAGWGDEYQDDALEVIPSGQGMWLSLQNDGTVATFTGEVGTNKVVEVSAGLTMVCNPLPVAISIQDIVPSEDFDPWGTDSLRVWTGSSYEDYYWFGADAGGLNDTGLPGWGDEYQDGASKTIAIGEGFWIQAQNDASISFNN